MTTLRIARPVRDLEQATLMYCAGLELVRLGSFEDHAGFDGVMLGRPGLPWHLEFTHCRHHPVSPAPTADDLLVLYLPEPATWLAAYDRMERAGFERVVSFNPYWDACGRTFIDPDGYRTVICKKDWQASTSAQIEG
jgi:hypothetical protein